MERLTRDRLLIMKVTVVTDPLSDLTEDTPLTPLLPRPVCLVSPSRVPADPPYGVTVCPYYSFSSWAGP